MKKINRYHILGLLGRGGMSKVYKVQVPVIQKVLALKLLAPHPILEDTIGLQGLKDLFRTEAVTLARLNHPHIVSVWDFGSHQGVPYYVMAYHYNSVAHLIGESARPDEPSRALSVDQCILFTRQTLEGLQCLHTAGIIHRDIKPFNLLVDQQDTIKICDFGLSKLRGESVKLPEQLKVGSPWYAAPEQERNPDSIDARADLYSVGISLQRMLTGELSTDSGNLPSRVHPDLDEAWDQYIKRATAPDRSKRFESAAHMLNSLDRLQEAWQRHKNKVCETFPPAAEKTEFPESGSKEILRSSPRKISPPEAAGQLRVDDLWRPSDNRRSLYMEGPTPEILLDAHTGCHWQISGSPYPLDWQNAHRYVSELNRIRFGGNSQWRLPTIEELLSLVSPPRHGDGLCIEPVFDERQATLWSCDRRTFVSAWYASLKLGFVGWHDFSARHHVRAVYSS